MGVLEAFQELYCDFWVLQDRVFSTQSPQSFFTFFGTPGGAAVRDVAMEAFLDDVAVTGRTVSCSTESGTYAYIPDPRRACDVQ
jgi:syntaxin-binding protein 1